ncbi:MAG: phosphatidate cytidylyltransferase [Planctomycetota bacterium]
MDENLRRRLTLGPVLLAVLGGVLALDAWLEQQHAVKGIGILALLLLMVPLANLELARLFTARNATPFKLIASLGGAAIVLHAFFTQFDWFKPIAASVLAFLMAAVPLASALRKVASRQVEEAITSMAGTLLAVMYLGGLAWFLMAIRVKEGGAVRADPIFDGSTTHIVMVLLCVKFTDIGAFFTGKSIGKRKLIAWLSPGKTWEGLVGGLVVAAAVGAACAPWLPEVEWWTGLIFGAVFGAVGQAGDLLESLMKRDAAVKDSGQSLPGFGGVLDVIDSPLVAAPVAYLLFSLA